MAGKCLVLYNFGTSYTEGVNLSVGTVGLSNIGPGLSIPNTPGSLGLSTSVPFTRASGVSIDSPDVMSELPGKTFSVSVLDYSEVTEPGGLYTGLVDSSGIDGLSIINAEDANDVQLVYSPPTPPMVVYDYELPDDLNLELADIALPTNSTNTNMIKVLIPLFETLEGTATRLVEDILTNVSTSAIEALNDTIFSSDISSELTLRGIDAPSTNDALVILARQKKSLARDLLIISRKANNTTLSSEVIGSLNSVKSYTHAETQKAELDNAKLNTSLAMQNITMSILLYNSEVQNAHMQYKSYETITTLETNKLNLYSQELRASKKAIGGNSKLAQTYRKQLSVVQQVFESYEQSMKLSEASIKLLTEAIDVETLNIRTETLKIEGLTDNTENAVYQSNTVTKAYGLNIDAELATATANLAINRGVLEKQLLELDEQTKNNMINIENDTLATLASSVSIKIKSVQDMFDLDNLTQYNSTYLSGLSSHHKATLKQSGQVTEVNSFKPKMQGRIDGENSKGNISSARIKANYSKAIALRSALNDRYTASQLMAKANTAMALNHTIT